MARIPEVEIERLKQDVSLVRLVEAKGRGVISAGSAMSIQRVLNELMQQWCLPRTPTWGRGRHTPPLRCTFSTPGCETEESEWPRNTMPADVIAFWRVAHSARLFEDSMYGQWGLEILPPREAKSATDAYVTQRRKDYRTGDVVLGRFLGDSDLLILRADPSAGDFGHVLVALPIDRRAQWYRVADSFEAFLYAYARAEGDKYWEREASRD